MSHTTEDAEGVGVHWYQSWPMLNLVAHPVSELLHWVGADDLGGRIHDATLPEHEAGTGRG
jgi:hypothetical protein